MVLTRETRDEIEAAIQAAIGKCIKSDSFIRQIVEKVTEAVTRTLQDTLTKLETSMVSLEEKFVTEIKNLEDHAKRLEHDKIALEKQVDRLDQANRTCNLRLFNLKEIPHENTREQVMQILNNKLALRLENGDIQICYRVGKKEENKPRGIFLKVKDQNIKEAIYRKKKLFKGSGIVVREDLTKVRLELLNYAIEKIGLKNLVDENIEKETKNYQCIEDYLAEQHEGDICGLRVIHFNIRSLQKHYDELLVYVQSAKEVLNVIVLSETGKIENLHDFQIPGYNAYYNESCHNKCDGTLIYVKACISANVKIANVDNYKFLRVILFEKGIRIGITAIYRPPSLDVDDYTQNLDKYLNGDINIDLLKQDNSKTNDYLNILNTRGFVSFINTATRKKRHNRD
nr:unnamed protein product [Callosobruchus analis]